MGILNGLGPGGGENPGGTGETAVGHLGLGHAMYGRRLPNIFMPGLPSLGGGECVYGDGGRKW